MPLTTCPDCKKDCSTEAASCPNCGKPLQQKSYMTKDLGAGGCIYSLLLGLGIVLALINVARPLGILLAIASGVLLLVRLKFWSGAAPK